MSMVGIVAEYNPLHRGHAYHLAQARRASGAQWVVVVMSGCFTQRGEAALVSPADRARMALLSGADAVILLPALWAVRDAEHFALGGVSLLDRLGADAISFGAETADLTRLTACARLMEDSDALSDSLRTHLAAGLPYPDALARAAGLIEPGLRELLASPNNTLAVCYLRAMARLSSRMTAVPVAREAAYHATALEADGLPSATALRGAVLRGDWAGAKGAMPESAFRILSQAASEGRVMRNGALDQALLYRLRTCSSEELRSLPDLSEGIEDRLAACAGRAASREELLTLAKTRRYPYARLSRLCAHALLGVTQADFTRESLPPAAWLLGFRRSAGPLLGRLAQSGVPLLAKAADAPCREDAWFRLERRAYDLWALGCGLPSGMALTQGVVTVP